MRVSRGRAWVALLAGSVVAASSRPASPGSNTPSDSIRAPAEPANASLAVRERLAETVSNGCHYVGTVRGKLAPRAGSNDDDRGPSSYAPTLVVNAEVDCGRGAPHRAATTRVEGPRYTANELESAVRDAARVDVESAGHTCSYEPAVHVEGTNLSMQSVRESCRGGGPRSP
jgi:hypothetical protein